MAQLFAEEGAQLVVVSQAAASAGGRVSHAVVWHELWDGRLDEIAAAIDPDYDHASWSENFPWTRLPGVGMPETQRPMVDLARVRVLDPVALRTYIGDGNFGGRYQRQDEEMQALWQIAVEETRALLTGSWGEES